MGSTESNRHLAWLWADRLPPCITTYMVHRPSSALTHKGNQRLRVRKPILKARHMEFADSETIDKSTWAELVKQIQSLQEHQHQWVFRALGRWDPKGDPRKVPITSSFDTAWKRRVDVASDHPPPAGTRKLYEAWILYEFKREAHNYLAQL